MNSIKPHDRLRRAVRAALIVGKRKGADPIAALDLTPPQKAFLESASRRKNLRLGNQSGKTTVAVAECVMLARGTHPRQRFVPPLEIWIVVPSRSTGLAAQKKIAAFITDDDIGPKHPRWNSRTGWGHHEPSIEFRNGSVIRFKTIEQRAARLASGTVHHILLDEFPPSNIYSEAQSRLRATGGTLSIAATPVNADPDDVDAIRKLCESGQIEDLHFEFTPENFICTRSGKPRVTEAGEVCDAEWVKAERASVFPWLAPVILDGGWEPLVVDRFFPEFKNDPKHHVHDRRPGPKVTVHLTLGIDHGAKREAAVLVAIEEVQNDHPNVYVLDEYRPAQDMGTTPEDDAVAIRAMLERNHLKWADLDYAYGDRPTSAPGAADRKGNYDIEDVLARKMTLRNRESLKPRIFSAKRGKDAGRGAVHEGSRWIHQQMLRPGKFAIHPQCTELIRSIEVYKGDKAAPEKDLIDALRYALIPWWRGDRSRRGPVVQIRNW